MHKLFETKYRLLVIIGLPLIIAALCMSLSTSYMLDDIARKVNNQEELRSSQAAHSALNSVAVGLEGITVDNARWDDAVDRVYVSLDTDWVKETWTIATSDRNYDTFFLIDWQGKTLAAGKNGEEFHVTAAEYLSTTLPNLLAALPSEINKFEAVSSLTKTKDGAAVIAAAPILNYTEGKPIPSERPNYLLFMKSISPDLMAELGKSHILNDFELRPLQSVSTHDIISDDWGNPVGELYWTSADPGRAARDSSFSTAMLGFLVLVAVMLPLAILHYRAMAKMESNEAKAFAMARRDNLSGLHNRVMLIEQLSQKIPKSAFQEHELFLAFIDLDGFKAVNDAFGHDIGDELIRAVSAGLAGLKGDKGILVRLGGDEFAVLMQGIQAQNEMSALAENILTFVQSPFDIDGRLVDIGASIGIARCTSPNMEASEFMRQADIAMYDAKAQGGNTFRWFDISLDAKRLEELEIAAELHHILANDKLEVAYQPFVSCADRSIIGVEALARWPMTSARKISPEKFIDIAEEHGLIDKLGNYVIQKACHDMVRFEGLKVAVNISALQLRNLNFVSKLKEILCVTGLEPKRLEVEFTESVVIQCSERAKRVIQELHAIGVSVALDDFGTGYASVGYLREYAFDKIKLDRSLTQSLSASSLTQNIVQGTVLIAKGLSAEVTAEGVETEEEAKLMRLAGCGIFQGYYFGKPQSPTSISGLLDAHNATAGLVA